MTRFGFRLPRDVERDLVVSLSTEIDRKKVIDYFDFIEAVKIEQDNNGDEYEGAKVISTRDTEVLDFLIKRIRSKLEDNLGSEAQSSKRVKEVCYPIICLLVIFYLAKLVLILYPFFLS